MAAMLKVGLYARVSTDEQVGPELSITNQIQRLERHLKSTFGEEDSKGYMVRKRYREEGRSGKDIAGRPELQQLLSDVREGAIDTVCCAELARLSRSVKDIANILSEFDERGITFVCLNPAVDTSRPSGKLVLNVMAALAEYEREQTVERTRAAMYDRAQRGLWNGGRLLGYDLEPNRKGYLKINQQEAEIVRKMFETYLQEKSIGKAVEKINDMGYRTAEFTSRRDKHHSAREFTYSSVRTILTNVAYLGKKEINKKKKDLGQDSLPENERYQVVDGVWPAIIDEETFALVQQTLAANTRQKGRVRGKHTFLLSGLVECSHCNLILTNGSGRSRSGAYHYYYTHPKKTKRDDCQLPGLPAAKFEQVILEKLGEIADDTDLLERACERANTTRTDEVDRAKSELATLREMETEENKKLDVLLEQIGTRQTTLKPVERRLEQLSNTIEQVEQEVAEKQAEIEDLQKSKADPKRIGANLKSFGDILEGVEAGDRQLLVGLMVKRIRIAPTRIELELYDRSPIIEDWSKGEKDGWFRTRLSWLPSPMSSGTTIWVGVDVDMSGFEGAVRGFWEETGRKGMSKYAGTVMVLLPSECEQWRRPVAA